MKKDLLKLIYDAVDANSHHIQAHLKRINPNDHSNIKKFQEGVLNYLKKYSSWWWDKEQPISSASKVSVDILGDIEGRRCIIEIDTVRHDQISAKFVSRLALLNLKEPIDYVAILYDSTQKSGPLQAQTYIKYMQKILYQINKESSVVGIYIHVDKISGIHKIAIW